MEILEKQSKIANESAKKKQAKTDLEKTMLVFQDIFSFLNAESKQSIEYLDMGLMDSLAQNINDALKNPINTSFDAYIQIEQTIKDLLNQTVIEFFKKHLNFIRSAYLYKTSGNYLFYSIITKEDNEIEMNKIYQFVNSFDRTKLRSRFEIIFEEIPLEVADEFEAKEVDDNYIKII